MKRMFFIFFFILLLFSIYSQNKLHLASVTDNLELFDSPAANAKVIAVVPAGEKIELATAESAASPDLAIVPEWLQLKWREQTGWTTRAVLKRAVVFYHEFEWFHGEYNMFSGIAETPDGGFILCGECRSADSETDKGFMVARTDILGGTVWIKNFGEKGYSNGYDITRASDGGFVICGTAEKKAFLLKIDINGEQVWRKEYRPGDNSSLYDIEVTADGGFILCGDSYSEINGNGDMLVIKTDREGNFLWIRTYGGGNPDGGYCVKETADGGFIISGFTRSEGKGQEDALLLKTDRNGNERWRRTFGGSASDSAHAVVEIRNGSYLLAGETRSFGGSHDDNISMLLAKTDARGSILLMRNDRDYLPADWLAETSDGEIVLLTRLSENFGLSIMKLDGEGNGIWTKNVIGKWSYGGKIIQTSDGDLAICGATNVMGGMMSTSCSALIMKIDQHGMAIIPK